MFAAANKGIMDTTSQIVHWHYETLPRQTKKALDFLSKETWLKNSSWYLAGGTALALQTGNRKSLDLDFFTEKRNFDVKKLLAHFIGNNDWLAKVEEKNTIYGELLKAKVSFIAYPFFLPKQTPSWYGNIRVLDPSVDASEIFLTCTGVRIILSRWKILLNGLKYNTLPLHIIITTSSKAWCTLTTQRLIRSRKFILRRVGKK